MRKIARCLLLLFAFTIPWEYSLDLGAPWGNIARVTGLVLLLVAVLAVLQKGTLRKPGPLHWLSLLLYLWFCCSFLWSIAPAATGVKLRGYVQEIMLVWLVWELLETPGDLRNLLRAWLAGSWVLAVLTIANFAMADPGSAEQIRFVAPGQDPNDLARYIVLALPIAALLLGGRGHWSGKLLAAAYIPLGFACVLLTGSRSGSILVILALAGSVVILMRRNPRALLAGAVVLPAITGAIWLMAPAETLLRLGTIVEQLRSADLNQRVSIWAAGWHAFLAAPILGHGAGTFAIAARLAPEDTAHNTMLSIIVEGGWIALVISGAIVAYLLKAMTATSGALRKTLVTLMVVWLVSSLAGTVGESRTSWLLLATVALAGRLAAESPRDLELEFAGESDLIPADPVPQVS